MQDQLGVSSRRAARPRDTGAVRFFALLGIGLFVVHHLRYAFARLSPIEQQEAASVHSYLPFAVALLGVIVGAAVVLYGRELAAARLRPERPARHRSFIELWLAASSLLLVSYVLQESLESFAAHEPVALAQLFGARGWIVLILAPATAAVIAFFARSAAVVLERVARSQALPVASRAIVKTQWPDAQLSLRPQLVLLRRVAGRAPPLARA